MCSIPSSHPQLVSLPRSGPHPQKRCVATSAAAVPIISGTQLIIMLRLHGSGRWCFLWGFVVQRFHLGMSGIVSVLFVICVPILIFILKLILLPYHKIPLKLYLIFLHDVHLNVTWLHYRTIGSVSIALPEHHCLISYLLGTRVT